MKNHSIQINETITAKDNYEAAEKFGRLIDVGYFEAVVNGELYAVHRDKNGHWHADRTCQGD